MKVDEESKNARGCLARSGIRQGRANRELLGILESWSAGRSESSLSLGRSRRGCGWDAKQRGRSRARLKKITMLRPRDHHWSLT